MPRKDDLQNQIKEHQRRLQKLKEQQAKFGLDTRPHILTEIEDIETELATLQTELANLEEISLTNPYRGLAAFREQDAAYFFGRETFTAQLVERVQQQALVAVLGSSGSGKSSIVFAGLIPHLQGQTPPSQRGRGAGGEGWLIASFRPGREPFRTLAAALLPHLEPDLTERLRLKELKGLATDLAQADLTLPDIISRILEKSPQVDRFLLIADQFEELYTLCPDTDTRHAFLDLLLAALPAASHSQLTVDHSSLTIVLTLRADFMGQALDYRPLANALGQADLKLGPMTADELRQAIEKPAQQQGVSFQSGLAERILADVSAEPGHLPLLEFALTALWDTQTQGELTHAAYESIGRVEGALSRYADQVFVNLSQQEQEQAHRVFVQLVRPGEGTEDTRRLARRDELSETDWALVQQLAGQRLIVTDLDPSQQETAEVVHEALIRNWGQLRAWMNEDRRFRIWQERLRAVLNQWQATQQDEGALLRGAPLAEAEAWLADREADLSIAEREFIQTSIDLRAQEEQAREAQRQRELEMERQRAELERRRAEEQTRAAKRLRRLTFGLAGAFLLAVVIAVVAVWQSRMATAHQLAVNSQAAFTQKDFHLATLLALEANKLSPGLGDDLLGRMPYHVQYMKGFTLEGHSSGINSVSWSPDGRRLASGGGDDHITIWDADSGEVLITLTGLSDWVRSVAWSPDGRRLASGSDDGTITIWDTTSGEALTTLEGHTGWTSSVSWSPDGHRLASGGGDDHITIWDADSGKVLTTLTGNSGGVKSVAWSPDGCRLAAGDAHFRIIIWDIDNGKVLTTLTDHSASVTSVAWHPNGHRLASSSGDHITVWDAESGEALTTLNGHSGWINSVAWHPNGRRLASGSDDDRIIIWDTDSSEALITLTGHSSSVNSVAWSPDGHRLASGSYDNRIIIWDTDSGSVPITLTDHSGSVYTVAWSPDGHRLAAGGNDASIIWDTDSGKVLNTLTGHSATVWSVAWHPEGHRLAAGTTDDQIIIWDTDNGKILNILTGHPEWVRSVAWHPDGRRLAAASEVSIIIWDAESGEALTTLTSSNAYVWSVAWHPNGHRLASGSAGGDVIIWDANNGEALTTLDNSGTVKSIAWSPNGRRLAVGTTYGHVIIWDTESNYVPTTLTDHSSSILSLTWHPDGHRLAAGAEDGSIIIWDTDSGEVLTTLGHSASVNSVAWSPDGRHLAFGVDDGIIQLLPEEFARHPCHWLVSNLSVNEWLRYRGIAIYKPTCDNLPSPQILTNFPIESIVDLFRFRPESIYDLKILLLTSQGWLLLIGGIGLILGLIGLMIWLSSKLARWFIRKRQQRPSI